MQYPSNWMPSALEEGIVVVRVPRSRPANGAKQGALCSHYACEAGYDARLSLQ